MFSSRKTLAGAVIVVIAVLWQGIGTAIVGVSVAPQLSTFTTFTAFLIAAIISTIGYLVVRNKRQRSLNVDDSG